MWGAAVQQDPSLCVSPGIPGHGRGPGGQWGARTARGRGTHGKSSPFLTAPQPMVGGDTRVLAHHRRCPGRKAASTFVLRPAHAGWGWGREGEAAPCQAGGRQVGTGTGTVGSRGLREGQGSSRVLGARRVRLGRGCPGLAGSGQGKVCPSWGIQWQGPSPSKMQVAGALWLCPSEDQRLCPPVGPGAWSLSRWTDGRLHSGQGCQSQGVRGAASLGLPAVGSLLSFSSGPGAAGAQGGARREGECVGGALPGGRGRRWPHPTGLPGHRSVSRLPSQGEPQSLATIYQLVSQACESAIQSECPSLLARTHTMSLSP